VLDYAVRFCNKLFTCNHRSVTRYTFFNGLNSPATCMEYYQSRFSPARLSDSAQNGRLVFDETSTASCLGGLEQMSCDDFGARVRLLDAEFWTCRDTLQGQVSATDDCYASAECSSNEICVPAPGSDSCEGTCTAVQNQCGDQNCTLFEEYCDYSDQSCQPVKAAGASCSSLDECDWHLNCKLSSSNPTCVALSGGLAPDEVCNGTESICPSGTFCTQYYSAGPTACRRLKAEGGTCPRSASTGGCVATAYCADIAGDENSRCTATKDAAQSCVSNFECASGRCRGGACISPDTPCVTP
jgi:hypothetical protein